MISSLESRFKVIRQALEELHGANMAQAATITIWLIAAQRLARLAMQAARDHPHVPLEYFEAELERFLRAVQLDICAALKVDAKRALRLASAYSELIHDCFQGPR